MNKGVELLIARTKTNPEEFLSIGEDRWGYTIRGMLEVFSLEEKQALLEATDAAQRVAFEGYMMKALLDMDKEKEIPFPTIHPNTSYTQQLSMSINATSNYLTEHIRQLIDGQVPEQTK